MTPLADIVDLNSLPVLVRDLEICAYTSSLPDGNVMEHLSYFDHTQVAVVTCVQKEHPVALNVVTIHH